MEGVIRLIEEGVYKQQSALFLIKGMYKVASELPCDLGIRRLLKAHLYWKKRGGSEMERCMKVTVKTLRRTMRVGSSLEAGHGHTFYE